ncbi:MAG TPA: hypothetical protein VFU15_14640 [Bacteroidia bacterium]|nr:hypothetical protein [Bacteroidia bacterium]
MSRIRFRPERPWIFRRPAFIVFGIVFFLLLILAGLASNEMYNKYIDRKWPPDWSLILKPLWQAPIIALVFYACAVAIWFILWVRSQGGRLL